MFLFGKTSSGILHTYNDQCIKTNFILLGVPLVPVASYYQLSPEKGIRIPLNAKSILYSYGRIVIPIAGIVMLLAWVLSDTPISPAIPVSGALLLALGIYSWRTAGKPNEQQKKVRDALEQVIGYNMLPEHLPETLRMAIFQELVAKVAEQYGTTPVDELLLRGDVGADDALLLYCAAYYMDKVQPNAVSKTFLEKHQL